MIPDWYTLSDFIIDLVSTSVFLFLIIFSIVQSRKKGKYRLKLIEAERTVSELNNKIKEYETLANQKTRIIEEVSDLKRKLNELDTQKKEINKQIDELTSKIRGFKHTITSYESRKADLEEENSHLSREIYKKKNLTDQRMNHQ